MSRLINNRNEGAAGLRKLLQGKGIVKAAGVFSGISALIAESADFGCLYLSGSGVAGNMGLPDLSLTTLSEVSLETERITRISSRPLIVDVDTGFGESLNVARTVATIESAGAAGIHLEDQLLPKKCGHLSGKELVPREEMASKIRAAVRSRRNDDFMIIARTDSIAVEGIDSAIERANLYAEEGADAVFPEAPESVEDFKKLARNIKVPLLANMTEFGKSPLLSADELGEIGFRIVIYPLTGFRAALSTLEKVYRALATTGTQRGFIDSLMTREEYYRLIGYYQYEEDDREYSYKKGGS